MLRFPMLVEIYIQGFFLKKGFFFNGLLNNNGPKKLKVSKINQAIDMKTAAQNEAVSSLKYFERKRKSIKVGINPREICPN